MITLRKYFRKNKIVSIIRVCLIVAYALVLSITIALHNSFSVILRLIVSTRPGDFLSIAIPIIIILYSFWIPTIQLVPSVRKRLETFLRSTCWPSIRKWLGFGVISQVCRKLLPRNIYAILNKFLKKCFFLSIFATPFIAFILQLLFAGVSLTFVLLQKFSPAPEGFCSLTDAQENTWGFGQTLPLVLLLIPVLTVLGTYYG